jgi:hypothetical protein
VDSRHSLCATALWRDIILRVWHADPLRCPVCQTDLKTNAQEDLTLQFKAKPDASDAW